MTQAINLYDATIPVFTKMLTNIERWLDKAEEHARARKYDSAVLLQSRMAPDQWALARQVGATCDAAKWAVGKMTGKDYPSHPDNEERVDELRARIRSVLGYLGTFKREDFVNCEERPCTHNWMGGKQLRATDYLDHFALPNFYFHYAHVYALLRSNGVELGKSDYLGQLPFIAA